MDDLLAEPKAQNNHSGTQVAVVPRKLSSQKAKRRRMKRSFKRAQILVPYQVELLKLQRHLEENDRKMVVLFEGRDAAGKGGTIRRVTRYMNEKHYRVVALGKPTEEQRGQWYLQKYVANLPSAGEMVLFDRSWYNRAMVEPVFGFCTPKEHKDFLHGVVGFEKNLSAATRKATVDISEKISAIQRDSRDAIQEIDEIDEIINDIHEIQASIAIAVQEQNNTTLQMSTGIAEAAHGSKDIAHSIASMARTANVFSAGASETHSAAAELGSMAAALEALTSTGPA